MISISEVDVAVEEANVRVTDCILSVPEDVWKVKVSEVVAEPPGVRTLLGVSVPVPRVTKVDPGDTALVGVAPVE